MLINGRFHSDNTSRPGQSQEPLVARLAGQQRYKKSANDRLTTSVRPQSSPRYVKITKHRAHQSWTDSAWPPDNKLPNQPEPKPPLARSAKLQITTSAHRSGRQLPAERY